MANWFLVVAMCSLMHVAPHSHWVLHRRCVHTAAVLHRLLGLMLHDLGYVSGLLGYLVAGGGGVVATTGLGLDIILGCFRDHNLDDLAIGKPGFCVLYTRGWLLGASWDHSIGLLVYCIVCPATAHLARRHAHLALVQHVNLVMHVSIVSMHAVARIPHAVGAEP